MDWNNVSVGELWEGLREVRLLPALRAIGRLTEGRVAKMRDGDAAAETAVKNRGDGIGIGCRIGNSARDGIGYLKHTI
eukprot:365355-Chlamydomonas_euryale.AAC.11